MEHDEEKNKETEQKNWWLSIPLSVISIIISIILIIKKLGIL